jgi:hypothetical protein
LLLLNSLSTEQCRVLFPKRTTKAQDAMIADLLKMLEATKDNPSLEQRKQQNDAFVALEEMRAEKADVCVGRRVDVQVTDDTVKGLPVELLIDVTVIHPTCASKVAAELKSTEANVQARKKFAPKRRGQHPPRVGGNAVQTQHTLKHVTYAPLMAYALQQQADGTRPSAPVFLAGVCSTLGEFGPDMFTIQESLTKAYQRKLVQEGDRLDGYKPERLTAIFRSDFKASVHVAVAKGLVRMIRESGLAM